MAETTKITDELGDYVDRLIIMAHTIGQEVTDIQTFIANSVWLSSCNQADSLCQNDFADILVAREPFGVLLPASIQNGVVGLAVHYYLRRVFALVGETVGDLSESYSSDEFRNDMERHFLSYRVNPGF